MPELIITMIFAATFTGIINEVPILIYRYCIRKAPCKPGAKTWWLTFLYSVIVNVLFCFAVMQIYGIEDLKFTLPYLWIIVSYFVVIHGYDENGVAAAPDGSTVRNSHAPVIILSCISIAFFALALYLYVLYAGQVSVAEDAIQQYENLEDQYSKLEEELDSAINKNDELQEEASNQYESGYDKGLRDAGDRQYKYGYYDGYNDGYNDGYDDCANGY